MVVKRQVSNPGYREVESWREVLVAVMLVQQVQVQSTTVALACPLLLLLQLATTTTTIVASHVLLEVESTLCQLTQDCFINQKETFVPYPPMKVQLHALRTHDILAFDVPTIVSFHHSRYQSFGYHDMAFVVSPRHPFSVLSLIHI